MKPGTLVKTVASYSQNRRRNIYRIIKEQQPNGIEIIYMVENIETGRLKNISSWNLMAATPLDVINARNKRK